MGSKACVAAACFRNNHLKKPFCKEPKRRHHVRFTSYKPIEVLVRGFADWLGVQTWLQHVMLTLDLRVEELRLEHLHLEHRPRSPVMITNVRHPCDLPAFALTWLAKSARCFSSSAASVAGVGPNTESGVPVGILVATASRFRPLPQRSSPNQRSLISKNPRLQHMEGCRAAVDHGADCADLLAT